MRKILIVEDEPDIQELLCTYLREAGYETAVAGDGIAALHLFQSQVFDLVLLDLNLPGVDGQFVCREVRRRSEVPIVVVTSRDNDMDELLTLSLGADDFVPKPYNDQVLLAHVATVLKRSYGEGAAAAEISHGGVALDTARCRVSFQGRTAELTKNELRILALLMRNAGAVVSRQRIQEELWASDEFVDDNTLTVNVSHLRSTLAKIGVEDYVLTKRGMGYLVE